MGMIQRIATVSKNIAEERRHPPVNEVIDRAQVFLFGILATAYYDILFLF